MSESANYMRVVGPHCCIRCDFKCDTSDEITEHLNSKHPGWMTEKLRPEMFTEPTKDRAQELEPSEAVWAIRKLVQCTKDDPCAYDNSCKNHRQLSDLLYKESEQWEALAVEGSKKMLQGLGKDWQHRKAHTYSSENADHYRGFDAGLRRCVKDLKALEIKLSSPQHAVIKAEIEQKAIEKAMKAKCRYCLEGIPRHHAYHKTDGAGIRCEAWPIPQLIDKALQSKEEG